MDKMEVIYGLIVAVVALIPTVAALIVLIKNIITNKNWQLVVNMALEAMTTVEEYAKEHPDMTSDEKLEMALEAIKSGCEVAGITFDESLITQIKAYIEEMCSWSKTVNADGESEETEETVSE